MTTKRKFVHGIYNKMCFTLSSRREKQYLDLRFELMSETYFLSTNDLKQFIKHKI